MYSRFVALRRHCYWSAFLGALPVALLIAACNPFAKTKIGSEWHPGVAASAVQSELSASASEVVAGESITVTLKLRDKNGEAFASSRPVVSFSAEGGTSVGTFGDVTNDGQGNYSASFTGVTAGTATTLRAKINGAPLANNSPTVTVLRGPGDPFTFSWAFDALDSAQYTFDSTLIRFRDGLAELISFDQSDDSAAEFSTASGTQLTGVSHGALADGSDGLKLGSDGGCDGSATNCAELDASWAPQWSSLIGYWTANGAVGGIANNAPITATVGSTGTAKNTNGLGMAHVAGRMNEAISFDGTDDYILGDANLGLSGDAEFTMSAWIYWAGGAWSGNYPSFMGTAVGVTNRSLSFTVQAGRPAVDFWNDRVRVTSPLTVQRWYHIVGTKKPGSKLANTAIYVDGVPVAVGLENADSAPDLINAPWVIGRLDGTRWFNGYIDDAAIWNKALTAEEVRAIYERQSAKYSGTFTSRVIDVRSDLAWTGISWLPTLPFFKELPDASCSPEPCGHAASESNNSITGYASLYSDALMSGIVGLWHFNETAATAGANNDFRDDSGQGNHGEASGTVGYAAPGRLAGALSLSGSAANYAAIPDANSLDVSTEATFAVWIKPTSLTSHTNVFQKVNSDADASYMLYLGMGNRFRPHIRSHVNAWRYGEIDYNAVSNQWYHVVYTYASATGTMRAYVDGTEYSITFGSAPSAGETIRLSAAPLYIGLDTRGQSHYSGTIDELAIWNRVLQADEIKQLYQRGASRLKFQVRTCDDSSCVGSIWQGPDGTTESYFSELNNNSVPLSSTGLALPGLPSMSFSDFTAAPAAKRYFQYRSIFEAETSPNTLGPQLKSVDIDPVHYPAAAPTVVSNGGVDFYKMTDFVESLGVSGCASGVVYNLALSNAGPWKYWDGSAWVTSDGSIGQASSAATIQAKAASFGEQVGRGTIYIKAFMQSSGLSKCELDNVQIGGRK